MATQRFGGALLARAERRTDAGGAGRRGQNKLLIALEVARRRNQVGVLLLASVCFAAAWCRCPPLTVRRNPNSKTLHPESGF